MAAGVVDGALIIDTGIDNSGANSGSKELLNLLNGLKRSIDRIGQDLKRLADGYLSSFQRASGAAKKMGETLESSASEATHAQQALRSAVEETTANIEDEYRALLRAGSAVSEAERNMEQALGINVDGGAEAEAWAEARDAAAEAGRVVVAQRQAELAISEHIRSEIEATEQAYQSEIEQINQVESAITGVDAATQSAAQSTQGMAQTAADAADTVRGAGEAASEAAANANNGLKNMQHIFKNVLKYGFGIRSLFVLFNRLRRAIKDSFATMAKQNPEVAAQINQLKTALADLKSSLAVAFLPIFTAVQPALLTLINLLTRAFNAVGMFLAALGGRATYSAVVSNTDSLANSVGSVAENAAAANDEVKSLNRQLASFDDLNVLSDNKSGGSGGGGGGGGGGGSTGPTSTLQEMPISTGLQEFASAMTEAINDTLSKINLILGGATLAVGAILALSGVNVPLGLGLMATGAVTMGSAIIANWKEISDAIKLAVVAVESALAGGLAVGAILAFSGGHIGLGIGLMIGALSAGTGAVTLAWNTIGDTLSSKVQAITTLIGGAALGIGAVLAFAAHPEIGIPMMIAGASVAAVSVNWNYIKEKLQGPIGIATALISGASLVLGILALVSGNVPIGLGLILEGTAGLASTVAANWDNLVAVGKTAIEKVKQGWETIKELVVTAWVALKKKVSEWASDVWDFLVAGAETIVKTVQAVGEGIAAFATSVWMWIRIGAEEIVKTVQAVGEGIASFATNAWLWIRQGAETIVKTIQAIGEGIATFATSVWMWIRDGAETISKTVQAIGEGIATFAGSVWLWIRNGAETIAKTVQAIGEGIATFAGSVWLWIRNGAEEIEKTVQAVGKGIATFATDAWLWIRNGAQEIVKTVQAVGEGIAAFATSVWMWIRNGAENIEKTVKAVGEGIASFATDAWIWIRNGAQEIVKTVKAVAGDVSNFVGKVWDFITGPDSLSKTVKAGAQLLTWFSDAVWNFITGASELTKSIIVTITEKVSEWFKKFFNWLNGNGTNAPVEVPVGCYLENGEIKAFAEEVIIGWDGLPSDLKTVEVETDFDLSGLDEDWKKQDIKDRSLDIVVNLIKKGGNAANGIVKWAGENLGSAATFIANLTKKGSNAAGGFKKWAITGSAFGSSATFIALLKKSWKSTPQAALGLTGLTAQIKAQLVPDPVKKSVRIQTGTIVGGMVYELEKLGGIFQNGLWSAIPQYAGGTTNAHGSLFLAGEAGPEIVGHVGGRTEVLNKSQLASTMFSAVENGILAAASRIQFRLPSMATGTVMPYDVSAQIAKSTADLQGTLDANNEDLIQTIISVAGQIVAAVNGIGMNQASQGGMSAQQIINEINRRTQMFGASPIMGV